MLEISYLVAAQLAAFQGLLLVASAVHKLLGFERARTVMQDFVGIPRSLGPVAVVSVALTELLAALALWVPSYRAAGAILASLIWGGYLLLIVRAIAQGRRDVDCGCSFAAGHSLLGAFQVARNVVLMGLGVTIGLVEALRGAGASLDASQVLAALALLALYGALDQVMNLQPLRSRDSR
jgi:hypothetical protein